MLKNLRLKITEICKTTELDAIQYATLAKMTEGVVSNAFSTLSNLAMASRRLILLFKNFGTFVQSLTPS